MGTCGFIQEAIDEIRTNINGNQNSFSSFWSVLRLVQVRILFHLTTPTKSWWAKPKFLSHSQTNLMSPVRPTLRWTPGPSCLSEITMWTRGSVKRLIWLFSENFSGSSNIFSAPRGSLWMWSGSSLERLSLRSWTQQQAQNRSEIRFRADQLLRFRNLKTL